MSGKKAEETNVTYYIHTRVMLPQDKRTLFMFSHISRIQITVCNISRSRVLIPMVTNANQLQGAKAACRVEKAVSLWERIAHPRRHKG